MEGDKIVGYKLNGGKMWITNGGVAGVYTILARAPKGVSWFIIEKGTKGLSSDKHEDKHGIRLSDTTPVNLQDVYVPAENLVGEVEGKGMRQAQAVFGYTRLMVAAMALGTGWKALEHAIRYSQQRKVGGQPLSTKQGFTHKLIVPFAARLEACRAYIEEVARRIDAGEEGLQTEGAIAKMMASETANKGCDNAIQAFGGNGYVREFPVEKLKRDIKITCIYEGTTEILQLTTFRERWQANIKRRGQVLRQARRRDGRPLHSEGASTWAPPRAALALRELVARPQVLLRPEADGEPDRAHQARRAHGVRRDRGVFLPRGGEARVVRVRDLLAGRVARDEPHQRLPHRVVDRERRPGLGRRLLRARYGRRPGRRPLDMKAVRQSPEGRHRRHGPGRAQPSSRPSRKSRWP